MIGDSTPDSYPNKHTLLPERHGLGSRQRNRDSCETAARRLTTLDPLKKLE